MILINLIIIYLNYNIKNKIKKLLNKNCLLSGFIKRLLDKTLFLRFIKYTKTYNIFKKLFLL